MDNEMQQTNPNWYKELQYKDVKVYIRDNINSASRSFVAIGYYLKYVRDNQLFVEDGYSGISEFAKAEFGIGKSSASRFMAINDRFSKDGNSPVLLKQYRDFSSSKLSEMLTMSDEQLDQVSITTTVAEIREIKQPAKEEVVAMSQLEPGTNTCFIKKDLEDGLMCAGGISDECNKCDRFDPVETEEKSIDDLELSVRTYNCLKRAGIDTINELCDLTEDKVIAIRNVSRKCLDEINEKVSAIGKSLKSDITEIVSIESEYIETVTNETEENRIPDPDLSCKFDPDAKCLTASKESCKRNNDDGCMYSSGWDEEDYIIAELDVELDPIETVEADIIQSESEEVKQGTNYSINKVYSVLQKAKSDYEEVVKVGGVPEALTEKRLIIQDALLDYYQELRGRDTVWYQKPQPELPILRNNDQRKEFIDTYETWPIWIDIKETGERYYRYDFDSGVSFIIRVSLRHKYIGFDQGNGYSDETSFEREEYFILGIPGQKWEPKEKTFTESGTNKSALVEYLKDYQKK